MFVKFNFFAFIKPEVQSQFMVGSIKTKPHITLIKYIFLWLNLNLIHDCITKQLLNHENLKYHSLDYENLISRLVHLSIDYENLISRLVHLPREWLRLVNWYFLEESVKSTIAHDYVSTTPYLWCVQERLHFKRI